MIMFWRVAVFKNRPMPSRLKLVMMSTLVETRGSGLLKRDSPDSVSGRKVESVRDNTAALSHQVVSVVALGSQNTRRLSAQSASQMVSDLTTYKS